MSHRSNIISVACPESAAFCNGGACMVNSVEYRFMRLRTKASKCLPFRITLCVISNFHKSGYRFYNGNTSLDNQGNNDNSFHGWSAFADSETTAKDFYGNNAGKTNPFNSFGWYLGFPSRQHLPANRYNLR